MQLEKTIRKHTLENAIKYEGKAQPGAVIGKIIAENPKEDKQQLIKQVQTIVKEINKLTLAEQLKKAEKEYPEILEKKEKIKEERILPELPNVGKKVVMRFAPYPSGPLHLGNARPALLNDEYCKKYQGKLLLVIDDTIGSEEKNIEPEAYQLIPEGLQWLGINYDKKIIYKSDRLDIYYKYAEEIIQKGAVYVCTCKPEQLREKRKEGIACGCRNQTIDITQQAWKAMFTQPEGAAALRIKTDMQHPNPAFRDRVLFRICEREHPKVGKKYRVWPMLEFSWAIDDYLLGITHVIRGKELMIESDMERFIWNIYGWQGPELLHAGLLQFEGVKLSKSKSKQEVKSGKYTGWDDPRTWSLQSLERRGFKPESIRKFILNFGMNQTEITAPIDALYSENRKMINEEANRYFMVETMKKIAITGVPIKTTQAPKHPENKEKGTRTLPLGKEYYIDDELQKEKTYRLMHAFNFKDGKYLSTDVDQQLQATMIHWLPIINDLIKIEILMDDGTTTHGFAEPALAEEKEGKLIQFERKYFCSIDKKKNDTITLWYLHR
ncbi:MAG: glutamate--tRNA ligase [Nanoarchaeota archaeon]|nr:glutamate--tRNA ligase [Nanoarchaeota archaeon]